MDCRVLFQSRPLLLPRQFTRRGVSVAIVYALAFRRWRSY